MRAYLLFLQQPSERWDDNVFASKIDKHIVGLNVQNLFCIERAKKLQNILCVGNSSPDILIKFEKKTALNWIRNLSMKLRGKNHDPLIRNSWTNQIQLKGRSPGLLAMGDDSCSNPGAVYWMDIWTFFIFWFAVKIVLFAWKRPKINEKEAGLRLVNWGDFTYNLEICQQCLVRTSIIRPSPL